MIVRWSESEIGVEPAVVDWNGRKSDSASSRCLLAETMSAISGHVARSARSRIDDLSRRSVGGSRAVCSGSRALADDAGCREYGEVFRLSDS